MPTFKSVHPKLPMRNKEVTQSYYVNQLDFKVIGDYNYYLILTKDDVELHFFLFKELNPKDNYGQVYIRLNNIEDLYKSLQLNNTQIHPNSPLHSTPWGQKEFALLDPDLNLITFGEAT